jgi:hypothetical protein
LNHLPGDSHQSCEVDASGVQETRHTLPEELSGIGEATFDLGRADSETLGSFGTRQALAVVKSERRLLPLRKLGEFLIETLYCSLAAECSVGAAGGNARG